MKDFIFIHIPKSAGSSILRPLRSFTSLHYWSPQRFTNSGGTYIGHVSIFKMLEKGFIKKDFLKKAIVFCFIRNPYKRAVSLFNHIGREEGFTSFESFVKNLPNIEPIGLYNRKGLSMCNPQTDWITDSSGNFIVNFIGKVDSINSDFKKLCKLIDIKPSIIDVVNKKEHAYYSSYYTLKTKKLIEEFYKEDFKLYYNLTSAKSY